MPVWWWAGEESNLYSRRRLIYSQLSSPPAQPTHGERSPSGLRHPWCTRTITLFSWSRRRDSNPEPAVYKTAALPIELRRRAQENTAIVSEAQRASYSGRRTMVKRPHPGVGRRRHAESVASAEAVAVTSAVPPPGARCAADSKRSTEPATAALSDSIRPRIGIRTRRSHRRRIAGARPRPSLPITSTSGPRRSASR